MFGIGMTELMVLFVVGLVVLGPKRLPSLARSLGRTLAEFRHASNDLRRDFMDVTDNFDVNVNQAHPDRTIDGSDGDAAKAAPPDTSSAMQHDASKDLSPEAPAARDPHADEDPETRGG